MPGPGYTSPKSKRGKSLGLKKPKFQYRSNTAKPAPKVKPLRSDVGRSVPKRPKIKQLDRENRKGLQQYLNRKPVFVPKRLPKYVGAPSQFDWKPSPGVTEAKGERSQMEVAGRRRAPKLTQFVDPVKAGKKPKGVKAKDFKAVQRGSERAARQIAEANNRQVDRHVKRLARGVAKPTKRNVLSGNESLQELRDLGLVSGRSRSARVRRAESARLKQIMSQRAKKDRPGDRVLGDVLRGAGGVKDAVLGKPQARVDALSDAALERSARKRPKVNVAGVQVNTPAAAKALKDARKAGAAPILPALKQLTRVSSGEGQAWSNVITAARKGESGADLAKAFAKGFGKGFLKNNTGYYQPLRQLGVKQTPAAALGFLADVFADPTTYVALGAGKSSRVALEAATRRATRGAGTKAARAVAGRRVTERAAAAAKTASAKSESAAALASRGESSAVKAQRERLARLEAAGRGDSRKANNIRRNLERAGRRPASRARRAESEARSASAALRALRKGKARSRFDRLPTIGGKDRRFRRGVVRGSKAEAKGNAARMAREQEIRSGSDYLRGRSYSAGFGGRRRHFTPRNPGIKGKFQAPSARRNPQKPNFDRVPHKGTNPVSMVSPWVKPSSEIPDRAFDQVRGIKRSERSDNSMARYESKALYEETRKNLGMNQKEGDTWVSVFERLDPETQAGIRKTKSGYVVGEDALPIPDEFAQKFIVNGRLKGSKRLADKLAAGRTRTVKSGQPVGDATKIRVPDLVRADEQVAAKAEASKAATVEVRAAEQAARSARSGEVRARVSEARSGAVARERLRARDRKLIAALPNKHPLRKALRNMLEARTEVTKAGKRLRNVKSKGPQARKSKRAVDNSELKFKDTPEGAQARYDAARARYAAARNVYERELEKFRAETDAQYGRGETGGAEQFSRQGESVVLRKVSDASANRAGYRAEARAADARVRKAYAKRREAKQELKQARVARRAEKRLARRVRPLAEGDVQATQFYPHRKLMAHQTYAERVGYTNPGARPKSDVTRKRRDVRPIDQINAANADSPLTATQFSTDPASDVASKVQDYAQAVAYNDSLTRLANTGREVRFKGFAGQGKRETVESFYRRYEVAPDGLPGNKVYRLGVRGNRYQLDELDSTELTHLVEGVRKNAKGKEFPVSPKGRYVVLNDAAVAFFNASSAEITSGAARGGEVLATNVVGRGWDRITQGMRRLAIFTPRYHEVNEMGDTWIMYTVVPLTKIPYYKAKAIPVLRYLRAVEAEHRDGGLLSPLAGSKRLGKVELFVGDRVMSVKDIADELVGRGGARQGQWAHFPDSVDPANRTVRISMDDPTKAGESIGAAFNRGKDAARQSRPVEAAVTTGRAAGRLIRTREDWSRTATFLYLMDEGHTADSAVQKMLDALIDYGDLSNLERRVLRRFMFFYTFPARQIPYQTKVLLTKPGKFAGYEKLRVAFANAQGINLDDLRDEPWWRQANAPIPVRIDGEVRWLSANLPLNLLNQAVPLGSNWGPKKFVLNNIYFALTSLSPTTRAPLESLTNRNLFFRSDINNRPDEANQTPAPALVVQAAKLDPRIKKMLGVYFKTTPASKDKKIWVMDKGWAYWLNQIALGPVRQVTDYGKFVGETGTSAKDRRNTFLFGYRADPSTGQQEAVWRLRDRLDAIKRELKNMQGDDKAMYSRRWDQLIEEGSQISDDLGELYAKMESKK